jgi:transcriptional regulator with XRE-family HTH domain
MAGMTKGAIGLRDWRTKTGKTQLAVAGELAIDPSFLSGMERGTQKPGADLMRRVEELTGVRMQDWYESVGLAGGRSRRPPRAA